AWRTVGKRALYPFQKAARHSFVAPAFEAVKAAERRLCWRRGRKRHHFGHERPQCLAQRGDIAGRDDRQVIDAAIFEAALMPIVRLARIWMHRRRQHRLTPSSKDLQERFLAALSIGTNDRRGPEIRASYLAAWIAEKRGASTLADLYRGAHTGQDGFDRNIGLQAVNVDRNQAVVARADGQA